MPKNKPFCFINSPPLLCPILKNLLFYKEINGVKIYAKTGFNDEAQIASIVGFYELNQQAFSFGLNLDIKNYKSLEKERKF